MSKYSNTVEYKIRTTLDSSGVAKLQSEFSQLQNHITQLGAKKLMPEAQVADALAKIKKIQTALTQAFNPKLGMLNSSAFMKNVGMSMNEMYKTLNSLGPAGQRAFTSMYGQISKIDTGMRSVSKTTDKIMNTLGNTVRWGLIASGFASIMRAVHGAAQYVSDLDRSLTNIMMVSGQTRDTMNDFAKTANQVAQRLGGTTVQMTEATKVFIQQGYSLEKSSQLGEYAVHLANVSEQDSATASDEITAYMNAFKIPLDDLGNAISKWAAVANATAVDVEELSVASQKAASVAATVGVDLDQFAGHIAAIESVTREAPENIGNGLKTIYSRIADISLGETLDDGVNLGSFSKALKKVGVEVLDSTGQLRDAGDILEDTMKVWQDLNQTQRAAVAKTVAGRFQLARFEALMNRADIYENAANISRAETGTVTYDRMQETYRESLEGRSKALQASVEEMFLNIFTTDSFYGAVDALQGLVTTLNDLIKATGGSQTALIGIANVLLMIGKNAMARGISNMITNVEANMQASQNVKTSQQMAQAQLARQGLNVADNRTMAFANDIASVNRYAGIMNAEQINQANAAIKERTEVELQLSAAIERHQKLETGLRTMLAATGETAATTEAQMLALAESLERDGVEVTKNSEVFVGLQNRLRNTTVIYNEFLDSLTAGNQNFQVTQEQAGKLAKYLRQLDEAGMLSAEQSQELTKVLAALSKVESGAVKETNAIVKTFKEFGTSLEFIDEALTITPEKLQQLVEALARARVEEEAAAAAARAAGESMQLMAHGLNIQNMVQGIASLGNAMLTAVFAVQSFKNLMNILTDETKSPFEKLEAGAMDFAMVLAMGGPLILSAIKGIKSLTASITTLRVAQTAANAQKVADNIITVVNTALTEEQIREKIKLAAVEGTLTEEQVAQLAAETGLSAAKIIDIAATEGLTVAMGELGVAIWTALAPVLPFIAAGAALAGLIAAIVISVQQADAHFHEFDTAVEKAGETLDAANTHLKETKNNLEEVQTALEKIKNSDDAFEGLTSGTLEWNNALYEANQQIQELIKKYPELAQYVTSGQYGQLILTKQGQERAAQLAQEELSAAQIQQLMAQRDYAAAKENQSAINEARANFSDILQKNTTTYGDETGSYSIVNNQGVVNDMKALTEEYKQAVLNGTVEAFAKERELNADQVSALERLIEAENNNTLALQAANKATAGTVLATNDIYRNADLGAQNIMQNVIAQEFEENSATYKRAVAKFDSDSSINWDNGSMQEWAVRNGVYGQGATYNAKEKKFYDANNNEIHDNGHMYEDIRAAYIAQAMEEDIAAHASEIIAPLNEAYENLSDKYGEGFAKIFTGTGGIDFKNSSIEDLMGLDLSNLNLEDLQALGFNSYEEFMEAFNAASQANPLKPKIDAESKYDFDSDQEINQYLEDNTNIERDTLDTATSLRIEEHESAGNQFTVQSDEAKKLQKELDGLMEGTERYTEVQEKLKKAQEDNTKDTELYRKAVQRAAAAEARQIKTLEEMGKHFEENAEILQTADKGSIEYAEALQQTKEDLAGLLDIDADKLSNGFASSAETLDLMRQSAEGNEEAFKELQNLAAQDLISQIEIPAGIVGPDGTEFTTDYVQEQLTGLIDALNAQDLGIDVEADIGTDEWYARINELLASGALTADQLTQVLSAAGYEGEIRTEKGPGKVPQTTYTITPGELTNVGTEENPVMFPSNFTMTPETKMVDMEVDIPVLEGATQKGGITNAAGAANRGGGGKGGGGGGGGGSKAKKVEKAEGAKSTVDPYNKVNSKLEELADSYTKVDKAKERMYGDRYRRAAEAEIRNLQDQNTQLEKRVEISEKIAEALRSGQDNPDYGIYLEGESLAKYGLTDTDLDGTVDNYIKVYNEALEKQNAAQKAAEDYWASTGGEMDETQQERYKELQEAQKKAAEYANKITEVTNKYQETMDKIRDDTQQIEENMYEIEDHVIDIWNYAKDAAKELGDFREEQVDLAETLATLWGDDATKSLGFAFDRFTNMFEANEKALADAIADYEKRLDKATDEEMKKWYQDQLDLANKAMENGTSVLDLNMQRMQQIFKAVDEWNETGKSKLFGSNEKAMWEAFDEAWKDAVDYASKLKGYIEDIHSNMQNVMDDMYEVMEERDKMFDQAKNQYEYLKDMTELVYGEKAYGTLETITRKQAQADEEHLKTLEQERQINHEMLESLEEGSEEYKDALEKERDLDSAILDIRKDIADTYREAKELANDLAIQNWLDNFTADVNGVQVPLEYAADAWERIKENADNYLDDLNRAWELEKLENEYLKLIDEAVDPNLQRQITEQMEQQLEYLREKDKLSQYDVNYANAQLEILQKTIALEDARANKNQMKLRRDSQGNYSYVYAADRNDVRDKENDLLDARMNGYNMSVEASTDATDRYLQKVQSMADALRDVANDQSLSQEQIEAITQSIIEDGYQFLDAMGEQLTTAQRNGIESYIQAAQELSELNAGNVLDISQQLEEGLIDDLGMVTDVFNAAVLEWVDGETGLSYFRDAANQAGEDIVRNVGDFVAAVGAANANIQTPLNDIQNGLTQTNQAMSDLTSNAKEFYNFLEDKSGVVQRAAQDLAYYQNKLTDMGDEMNAYYTEWNNRGKELESEKAINSQLNIDIDSLKKEKEQLEKQLEEAVKGSNKGSGGSGNKGNYSDSDIAWGIAQNIWTYGSWGNDPYRHSRITERYGEAIADLTQRYINDYWATGQLVNWDSDVWGYATGGYTGSWTDNENGRIALLHQKELVLNEEDTENMLAAISIVRDLVDKIKGSSFKDTMNSFTNNSGDFVGNNIEQRVEIKAEFPGVRSAADIENALINLSNKAYQYAYNQNEKFI